MVQRCMRDFTLDLLLQMAINLRLLWVLHLMLQ